MHRAERDGARAGTRRDASAGGTGRACTRLRTCIRRPQGRELMADAPRLPDPDLPQDLPMTIWEHLRELRKRLIASLLGLIPGIAIAWWLPEELLDFLAAPYATAWEHLKYGRPTLHFSSPADMFVAHLPIAIVVGLIFASPWVAYQGWSFIAPG